MDALFELLTLTGPLVVGFITVPVVNGVKRLSEMLDSSPPTVKQFLAVLIAFGLSKLGVFLMVMIPTDVSLFTGDDIEALLSAAIAMAIHAGKKSREPVEPAT